MIPLALKIIDALGIDGFSAFVKAYAESTKPIISPISEDLSSFQESMVEKIQAEADRLWSILDTSSMAFLIWREVRRDEDTHQYDDMSCEGVVSSALESMLESDVDEFMERNGMDEDDLEGYVVCLVDADYEEDRDEDEEEPSPVDEEADDSDDDVGVVAINDEVWSERIWSDIIMQVRGESARYRVSNTGEHFLIIPSLIELAAKIKDAPADTWLEHMPGWEFKITRRA